MFAAALARRLDASRTGAFVADIVFMLAGCEVLRLFAGHVPRLESRVWIPAALWACEGWRRNRVPRDFALGALFVALVLLPGHLQIAFYGLLGIGLFVFVGLISDLRQKRSLRCVAIDALGYIAVVLVGFGIAAIQLLPAMAWSADAAKDKTRNGVCG